jgi:hypothetical protein
MTETQYNFLRNMATKYIWWETPDEAMRMPRRVMAQVMNIGLLEDMHTLNSLFCREDLLATLNRAECGWFNGRSWHYWHYALTDATIDAVPPLPARFGE